MFSFARLQLGQQGHTNKSNTIEAFPSHFSVSMGLEHDHFFHEDPVSLLEVASRSLIRASPKEETNGSPFKLRE